MNLSSEEGPKSSPYLMLSGYSYSKIFWVGGDKLAVHPATMPAKLMSRSEDKLHLEMIQDPDEVYAVDDNGSVREGECVNGLDGRITMAVVRCG